MQTAVSHTMQSPRNIVIFCDGTWNSPEEEEFGFPTPTNVYKLYRACKDQVQSGGTQVSWYEPGVGSIGGIIERAWEGATGRGMGVNIRRGYAAIAAHYRGPQDKIFLIGFSRGAFTARSIAGMIQKVGLLKEPTRKGVEAAYDVYRQADNEIDPDAVAHRARGDVHRNVRVHAIGVWDTVGALGFSLWGYSFNLRLIWRNGFHRLSPNQTTDNVFHALAIDEKRTSFMPVLWHDSGDPGGIPTGMAGGSGPKVEEAWFRGVHSDVGGGYADSGLSDITLQWMTEKLQSVGLALRADMPRVAPDCDGRVHNSAQGPLWTSVASWPRWPPMRTIAEGATTRSHMHQSVAQREGNLARSGIDERIRRRLQVGENFDVEIRARVQWEYTGVILEAGCKYELSAVGRWQDWKDTPVGPEGQAPGEESRLKRALRWVRRKGDAPWMALIAQPNMDFGWRWKELGVIDALRYLFIRDPEEFTRGLVTVGLKTQSPIECTQEAVLWCFANDAWKYYDNNTGSVVLTIKRVA